MAMSACGSAEPRDFSRWSFQARDMALIWTIFFVFFLECIVKMHLDVRLSSDMIGIFETEKMFFSLVTSQHGCHRSGLVVIDRKSMG